MPRGAGFIAGYEARLVPVRFGLAVLAFNQVAMEKGHLRELPKFQDQIAGTPEVLECHAVGGDFDYVIKVVARDLKAP